MKLPLIFLLACQALAFAAGRPTGFLGASGIPWGASPEEAKRILQKQVPGIQFPENADDYHIELTGGTFAGQPVAKWVIEFPDRKFASATVTLKNEGSASTTYKEFRNQLVSKYGSATMDKKTGGSSRTKSPQPQAAGTMAVWKFTPTMKDRSSVLISAELTGAGPKGDDPQGTVTIKYVNETLTGTAGAADGKGPAKPSQPLVKKEEL
jgi:hypothetical protein